MERVPAMEDSEVMAEMIFSAVLVVQAQHMVAAQVAAAAAHRTSTPTHPVPIRAEQVGQERKASSSLPTCRSLAAIKLT